MSKSETVRHLIRRGLEAEQGDTEDEKVERESRVRSLAQFTEKAAAVGALLAILSVLLPPAAGVTISSLNLTVGEFGFYLIIGSSIAVGAIATILILVSVLGIAAIATLYGIQVGFFGRTLGRVVPTPDQEGA